MRNLHWRIAVAVVVWAAGCSGGGSSDAGPPDVGPSAETCRVAVEHLSEEFVPGERCISVMRLSYETLQPLGVSISCGPLGAIDEDPAREQAQADTSFGAIPAAVVDAGAAFHVFYLSPIDFGGVSVVSATTGVTLFGGGIVWAGRGDITFPGTWLPAETLVPGCGTGPAPSGDEIVVSSEVGPNADRLREALDTAWSTSLSTAIEGHGEVHGAHAMVYPRTVGVFDPDDADWVVFFESGP